MVVKTRASVKVARVQGAVPKQSTHKTPVQRKPETGFMLGNNPPHIMPSSLIEAKAKAPVKPRKPKALVKPKPAAKKPAVRKPRTKAAAKAIATPANLTPLDSSISVPLTRNQAPVVWQKNGPMGAIGYWLRSTGRNVMARLGAGPKHLRTQAPIGAKLRTKNDLLREIAVLRKENALMREKLGLPPMPFGRLQAGKI